MAQDGLSYCEGRGLIGIEPILDGNEQAGGQTRHLSAWNELDPYGNFLDFTNVHEPLSVVDATIHGIIQGPFCFRCYTRLYYEDTNALGQTRLLISHKCPRLDCGQQWSRSSQIVELVGMKRDLYGELDAEFRRTGSISPQQEPPLRKKKSLT